MSPVLAQAVGSISQMPPLPESAATGVAGSAGTSAGFAVLGSSISMSPPFTGAAAGALTLSMAPVGR